MFIPRKASFRWSLGLKNEDVVDLKMEIATYRYSLNVWNDVPFSHVVCDCSAHIPCKLQPCTHTNDAKEKADNSPDIWLAMRT